SLTGRAPFGGRWPMLRSWLACLRCWLGHSQGHRPARVRSAPTRSNRGRPRLRLLLEELEPRLAPVVDFSISHPLPFPEGDSGTTNMMFAVTRSGDLPPAVQVDYTTQDGTAVAGIDYVATSGTLFFAANQPTATIAVPVIGNTLLQSNRTFTVRLSNPLTSAA